MKRIIITTAITVASICYFYGQGENLFIPEYNAYGIPSQSKVGSYELVHLNNDADPDLVMSIVENDTSKILVKLGPNLEDITNSPDYSFHFGSNVKKHPFYIACSDIDNDLDIDIYLGAFAEFSVTAPVFILKNTTSGNLSFELIEDTGIDAEVLAAVPSPFDYDGDLLEDVLISDFSGQTILYRNLGGLSFQKIGANVLGLNVFNNLTAFDKLASSENLICYEEGVGFDLMIWDGVEYNRDTTNMIISNPDILMSYFYQPRITDVDKDGLDDLFLSTNSYSPETGYYSDTWLYQGLCVEDLIKNERPILNASYSASNSISSAGAVNSAQGVIFKAGSEINLRADFEVAAGSLFEVVIADCTAVEE